MDLLPILIRRGLRYSITFTGYRDKGSAVLFGSNGILDFGDGTSFDLQDFESMGDEVNLQTSRHKVVMTLDHTYPSPGSYLISFTENFHNHGILNIENSGNMLFS